MNEILFKIFIFEHTKTHIQKGSNSVIIVPLLNILFNDNGPDKFLPCFLGFLAHPLHQVLLAPDLLDFGLLVDFLKVALEDDTTEDVGN